MKLKNALIITVAVLALIAVTIGVGAYAHDEEEARARSEHINDLSGESSLESLAYSLNSMSGGLKRSVFATDTALISQLCAQAGADSAAALGSLSSLPYATHELERLTGYINGAGDYALWLSRTAARGIRAGETERGALSELSEVVEHISVETARIARQYADGALEMDSYGEGSDAGREDTVGSELRALEESLPVFPSLHYDGAFSATARDGTAHFLEGMPEVTEAQARELAASLLSVPEERVVSGGESKMGVVCYSFYVQDENGAESRVRLSKRGGVPVTFTVGSVVDGETVSRETAEKAALDFLRSAGFANLQTASMETRSDAYVFVLAPEKDGALLLPDAVTVAVSRKGGRVTAFDAEEYILHHRERNISLPAQSMEDSAAKISNLLTVRSGRLVLLGTDGGYEKLCWELLCEDKDGGAVQVFKDAASGEEIKIEIQS